MKAYLDLMLINAVMVDLGALHMMRAILGRPAERGKDIGISFILALRVFLIYLPAYLAYPVGIAFDALAFAVFYRREFFKRLVIFYLYLIISTFFGLLTFPNSIAMRHQIMVIEEVKGGFVILAAPLFYLFVDLATLLVDRLYHLRDYRLTVLLSSGDNKKQLKAYFDSGNSLEFNRCPVIFVRGGSFEFDPRDEVAFQELDSDLFRYPLDKIYKVLVTCGPRKESCFAYAAVVTSKADFYGCDLLLNVHLRR